MLDWLIDWFACLNNWLLLHFCSSKHQVVSTKRVGKRFTVDMVSSQSYIHFLRRIECNPKLLWFCIIKQMQSQKESRLEHAPFPRFIGLWSVFEIGVVLDLNLLQYIPLKTGLHVVRHWISYFFYIFRTIRPEIFSRRIFFR